MLSREDIEFMKQTRKQVVANRETPISVSYIGTGANDPITGESIEGKPVSLNLSAVVTEVTGATERLILNGIEVQTGDIRASIDIDLVSGIYTKIERILYDGKDYVILAIDKKGIGEANRIEVVGRLIR